MKEEPLQISSSRRNPGIDALRGLSILFVILNHVGIRIPLAKTALAAFIPRQMLRALNYFGYESVFIFFVISGFLITRRSVERWGPLHKIRLRDFYSMRAARIVPSLLLVVALLSLLHLFGIQNFIIDKPGQSLHAAIASALGLYLNWYEGITGYLPGGWDVLWSLSIEEVFYLAFPLVCMTLGRKPWLVVIVLGVLSLSLPFTRAAAAGNEIWQEKSYLPGMSAIAVGVLTALLATNYAPSRRWLARVLVMIGIIGIGSVLFAGVPIWNALKDGYMLLLVTSAASLVLGLHWQETSQTFWRLRGLGWLQSFGRLSYEIYLFHMFCVFAVINVARASGLSSDVGYVWYLPVIVLSWILGFGVARNFSDPLDKSLRRRFVSEAPPTVVVAQS